MWGCGGEGVFKHAQHNVFSPCCHGYTPTGKAIHASVGRIALSMCLTCASSGLLQTTISGLVQIYKRDETFNANEIANAVLGGLVAITGCCPFIDPPFAILIGGEPL